MTKQSCVHCGNDCDFSPILWEGKAFCCSGCKTVFQIISDNRLDNYYELEETPGIRVEDPDENKGKFAYLDNEKIQEKFFIFSEGNIRKVLLYIPSIHCSSCIWLLEHLDTLEKGIIHSQVNFVKKELSLTFDNEKTSLRKIARLLASVHYMPVISLSDYEKIKISKFSNKTLLYKIGIAAFAFGNIMLFSFPEYFDSANVSFSFRKFFNLINFLLALPVVFYSASDYFSSAFKNLKKGIVNIDLPIALGIITLFLQSCYEIFSKTGVGYFDSLVGLVFFLLIGRWYQNRSYQSLSFERDYRSYFPVAVTRIDRNGEEIIPLDQLKKNDRILIRNKELIPADSILINGNAHIDYSFVSGESVPVQKKKGEIIFAGGKQIGDSIELLVSKKVQQSYLTQLWNEEGKNNVSVQLKTMIDKISKYFTLIIIIIALLAGLFWYANDDISKAVYAFTSVLIVACPCALALSVPFTFGNGMRIFGRKKFYLKNAVVLEKLNKVDTIVFDKTGTITQSNHANIIFSEKKLSDDKLTAIKSVVRHSTHPFSTAIYNHITNNPLYEVENFDEIPGKGISAQINNKNIKIGSEEFVTGKRGINPLESRVYVSFDNHISGYFSIQNKYREGLSAVISELNKNYKIHVITGDNEAEKERLKKFFKTSDKLHFNQSPVQKLAYIRKLKLAGKNVLMVGDGLNDAGALKESHTGISIVDDIYQFSPACNGIMHSQNFIRFPRFLTYAKSCMHIVVVCFIISFLYNIVGLTFAAQGILSPIIAAILMPISSISIVFIATFLTNLFSLKYLK